MSVPDPRNVIIEYPVTLPRSTMNPNGRIAGERYAVRDAATAAAQHPDAVIIGYQGPSQLLVGQVTADYLNARIEALENATPGAALPDVLLSSVALAVGPVSGQLVPAQASRTGLLLVNTGTVGIYVKAGATATTADTLLAPGVIDDTTFATTTPAINALTAAGAGSVYVRAVGQ